MCDMSIPTTPGVAGVDEWHDASAESSCTTQTNNPLVKETNHEHGTSKESLKKSSSETDAKRSMQFSGNTTINIDLNIGPAPLCYEEKALQERENCDYSIKITLDMAKHVTAPRKIRIYADGTENKICFCFFKYLLKSRYL
jgi:hypothetical protein